MSDAKPKDSGRAKSKGMTPKKVYFVMLGLFGLSIVIAIAALVMGDMMLKKRATTLTDLKLQNHLLDEQQTALTKAQKDIEKYSDFDSIASSIVPQDKDQAKAVLELVQIAKESGIQIGSIRFPASTLGNGTAVPVPAATGTPTVKTPVAISQARPVDGIPGVYSLDLEVKPGLSTNKTAITYNQFLDFLGRLEKNRRTAQVTSLKIQPQSQSLKNPTLDFSINLNIYLKP